MVTEASNRLFLRTAARNAARSLGYDAATFEPRTFTYDQQTAYVQALAREILKYPNNFTDATILAANSIANKNYGPLVDSSASFDDFADAFADEALKVGESVAAVGEGVKTTLSMSAYLIPVVAVAVVGIWLWKFSKS